ncbi:hypothetical protein EV359DRAFT_79186 [Lentinula novae-zelandiae]|nr:hypothetical protein EV359DRAFT_79186 [Lentinula novae-zelandiae]
MADTAKKLLGNQARWIEKKVLGETKWSDDVTVTYNDLDHMKRWYELEYNKEVADSDFSGRNESRRVEKPPLSHPLHRLLDSSQRSQSGGFATLTWHRFFVLSITAYHFAPEPSEAVFITRWLTYHFFQAGAEGHVLSVTSNSLDFSLFFAGSFITSFQGNRTTLNDTNNPNVPFSPGALPFSSSLVPIPLQGAQIVSSPSSTDAEFSNFTNILWPAGSDSPGNTWLVESGLGIPSKVTMELQESGKLKDLRVVPFI